MALFMNEENSPKEVHFNDVDKKYQEIYLDSYKIRNTLGRLLKKLSQEKAPNKDDERLEKMEALVLSLYTYIVEVDNAFKLNPEEQAPKMKKIIDDFYSNKTLKENLKILVPEGTQLPSNGNRKNSERPSNGNRRQANRQNNKPANRQNKPANRQNKPANRQNKPANRRNNKPANRQNKPADRQANRQNKPAGPGNGNKSQNEMGILDTLGLGF